MYRSQPTPKFDFALFVRKFFVSAFVVVSFVAYAIHERLVNPDSAAPDSNPTRLPPTSSSSDGESAFVAPTTVPAVPTAVSAALPTLQPTPTQYIPTAVPPTAVPPTDIPAVAQEQYRDGQYTGTSANAYYGLVQVKAIIQNGRITDVQFLNWPQDRRTSQRINNQAIPYLKSEALQAQSAQVDLISGATLTSRAFIISLQSALSSAKA